MLSLWSSAAAPLPDVREGYALPSRGLFCFGASPQGHSPENQIFLAAGQSHRLTSGGTATTVESYLISAMAMIG